MIGRNFNKEGEYAYNKEAYYRRRRYLYEFPVEIAFLFVVVPISFYLSLPLVAIALLGGATLLARSVLRHEAAAFSKGVAEDRFFEAAQKEAHVLSPDIEHNRWQESYFFGKKFTKHVNDYNLTPNLRIKGRHRQEQEKYYRKRRYLFEAPFEMAVIVFIGFAATSLALPLYQLCLLTAGAWIARSVVKVQTASYAKALAEDRFCKEETNPPLKPAPTTLYQSVRQFFFPQLHKEGKKTQILEAYCRTDRYIYEAPLQISFLVGTLIVSQIFALSFIQVLGIAAGGVAFRSMIKYFTASYARGDTEHKFKTDQGKRKLDEKIARVDQGKQDVKDEDRPKARESRATKEGVECHFKDAFGEVSLKISKILDQEKSANLYKKQTSPIVGKEGKQREEYKAVDFAKLQEQSIKSFTCYNDGVASIHNVADIYRSAVTPTAARNRVSELLAEARNISFQTDEEEFYYEKKNPIRFTEYAVAQHKRQANGLVPLQFDENEYAHYY